MATYFRIASLALSKAREKPTSDNVRHAIERCRMEYARGGSIASMKMMRDAENMLEPVNNS